MRDLFRAKIADERDYQASRLPFRRKFFSADCRYDSRRGTLSRLESETIISVEERESRPRVITEQTFPFHGTPRRIRLRYHLDILQDDWVIREVESACFGCEGRGDMECPYCRGKRWLGTGDVKGSNHTFTLFRS
jgi:hypothetical protein